MTNHPITPPPELVVKWIKSARYKDFMPYPEGYEQYEQRLTTIAARWGADQELEACEKYWMTHGISPQGVVAMRYARRPQPPSLKEQALEEVGVFEGMGTCNIDIIRRALEALPE